MTGLRWNGRTVVAVLLVVAIAGAGAVMVSAGQNQNQQREIDYTVELRAQSESLRAQTEALRQLVKEVHEFRSTIENYINTQERRQTQSELLTVQQRRVSEATARLDGIRHDLDAAAEGVHRTSAGLAEATEELRRTPDGGARAALEQRLQQMKAQLDGQLEQQAQLRSRESEVMNIVYSEEMRWNELVNRIK